MRAPSLSIVMSAAITDTSPRPFAAASSPGLGIEIADSPSQVESHQLGPCSPASASTASWASCGVQPAI
jgi:hypothetical protein